MRMDGLTDGRSYVAKTTKQLEHALAVTNSTGVELRAAEVVGEGAVGKVAFDREVQRVRDEASVSCVIIYSILSVNQSTVENPL